MLAQFLGGIVQGTVSLGFSSLGMVDLYKRAQDNRQSMIDVLTSDPGVCLALATACRKGVAKLPKTVLMVMKQVIVEAEEEQELAAHPRTSVRPDGSDPDDP